MKPFLIVYGTSEGQTRKIAEHLAQAIRAHGFEVELRDSATMNAPIEGPYAGYFVGASVHVGQHQESVVAFVKNSLPALESAPSVFFSVSLSAASDDPERQPEAQNYVDAFLESTGWQPTSTWCIAGALRYSEYGFFKRLLMKRIAKRDGFNTDTSRDHEYTDWYALDRKLEYFLANAYDPHTVTGANAP